MSGFLAAIGAVIVLGIISIFVFFYFEAREIGKMAESFRLQLERTPNGFDFVEQNTGFFFFKLNESVTPYRECMSVSPAFRKFQISIGEDFQNGSIDRAVKLLNKIRKEQNCNQLTARYFITPNPGFRRVSVRMKIDAEALVDGQARVCNLRLILRKNGLSVLPSIAHNAPSAIEESSNKTTSLKV